MRWVNETRCPASLSCLRRPSIDVTAIVRNEVAVGIDRLSFMYLTSMPAPPRSGCGVAPGDGAGARSAGRAAAPPVAVVARTAALGAPPPRAATAADPLSMASAAAGPAGA